jgi:hypothetical protein
MAPDSIGARNCNVIPGFEIIRLASAYPAGDKDMELKSTIPALLAIVAAAAPCNARSLQSPEGSVRLDVVSGRPFVEGVFLNGQGPLSLPPRHRRADQSGRTLHRAQARQTAVSKLCQNPIFWILRAHAQREKQHP